jgi:hypothetical protein
LGNAHGGQEPKKLIFVYAGLNARDIAPVWRKSMKATLGIIIAIGLTLPAFGQQAVKAINPEGLYQLNLTKSTGQGVSTAVDDRVHSAELPNGRPAVRAALMPV